jgi:microcystin-dependent protein
MKYKIGMSLVVAAAAGAFFASINFAGAQGVPVDVSVPPGTVAEFAGATPPPGWLKADGSEVSRTQFAALFAATNTTYGAGNGSTTFNLPDLRGRFPVGVGQGPGLTNRSLGASGGEERHTLTIAEMPSHEHALAMRVPTTSPFDNGTHTSYSQRTANFDNDQGGVVKPEGGSQPHNNMPPFIGLNYIIKY